jgi:hypothetical protein
MRRRELIGLLGGAAAWPLAARAQQPAMPIVGFVTGRSPEDSTRLDPAFRKGLNETGYVEGQNVMVEYHWLDGQFNRLPSLMADLVGRRVAVIATLVNVATLAAKAATTTTPIVFLVNEDPVHGEFVNPRKNGAALVAERGGVGPETFRPRAAIKQRGNDICRFESSQPSQTVRSLLTVSGSGKKVPRFRY